MFFFVFFCSFVFGFCFPKARQAWKKKEFITLTRSDDLPAAGFILRVNLRMVYDICIEATLGTWSAVYLDSRAISYQRYSVLLPVLIAQTCPLTLL